MLQVRQDTGDPQNCTSDCSLYKHTGDSYLDICILALRTGHDCYYPDYSVSRRKHGTDQVYRGTKSGVTASDPSGKYRLSFHEIVSASRETDLKA